MPRERYMDGRTIRTNAAFFEAIRDRRQELGLSHIDLDLEAGLTDGYASKIEAYGRHYHKRPLSINDSLAPILDALDLALVLMPRQDAELLYETEVNVPLRRKGGTSRAPRLVRTLTMTLEFEAEN